MRIRPKDYIALDDKLFFAVVSEYQEDGRALTFLRYIKDADGMHKIETQQAHELISAARPELLFHSHYADIDLHGIALSSITKLYRPHQTVARLLKMSAPDNKQQDAIAIIKRLLAAGINKDCIGITGSLMLDTHNAQSDIDIVIYGRERFFAVRRLIKKYLAAEALPDALWQNAWRRRACALDFAEYKLHELRKFNKCVSGISTVDISMVPESHERFQENGPYKKIGQRMISGIVTDDNYAYDFPARYAIAHETIDEIVSYTATYAGQARTGEMIEAAGYIEQGGDKRQRLVVGTSREAVGEYLRLVQ